MKHLMKIEKFTESTDDPKLGDYVICYENDLDPGDEEDEKCKDFLSKNIGRIIKIVYDKGSTKFDYLVQYFNVPIKLDAYFNIDKIINDCRAMYKNEIIEWSKDKEEIEELIAAKKYNL